jgi:protein-S-isoprenylcysteine O-methyltransferase Ste14
LPAAYLASVALYLLGLGVRDVYEVLKKTDRIDPRNPGVFATVFASMIVMWLSWFAMGLLDPTARPVPGWLQWGGLAVVIGGFVLAVGGMLQLRGVENIETLTTTGLFAAFRHPMYVGFALWILGWSAFQGALASLTIGSLGLISIAWWRALEERELATRYGEAYAAYRASTWF